MIKFRQKTFSEDEIKTFSAAILNKYDIIKILGKSGSISLAGSSITNWKQSLSYMFLEMILNVLQKTGNDELAKNGLPALTSEFNNSFLESELNKLKYFEGFNYSVGEKKAACNISLNGGLFIVTAEKGKDSERIDETYWNARKAKINRTDAGKVIVYTYWVESRSSFEFLLRKLMSTGLEFNIFEG